MENEEQENYMENEEQQYEGHEGEEEYDEKFNNPQFYQKLLVSVQCRMGGKLGFCIF